jgi:hypothetical protein
MGIASLPQSVNDPQGHMESHRETRQNEKDWMGVAVGGSLLVGSLLMLSGKRRAGLLLTAAGTALALVEEQEMVRAWWQALPGYLDNAQRVLEEAQKTIDDLSSKRDKLRALFNR